MAKIRALSVNLPAGKYKVSFRDGKGRGGVAEFNVTDGVDLEYSWYDFAAVHGFPIDGVNSLEATM